MASHWPSISMSVCPLVCPPVYLHHDNGVCVCCICVCVGVGGWGGGGVVGEGGRFYHFMFLFFI